MEWTPVSYRISDGQKFCFFFVCQLWTLVNFHICRNDCVTSYFSLFINSYLQNTIQCALPYRQLLKVFRNFSPVKMMVPIFIAELTREKWKSSGYLHQSLLISQYMSFHESTDNLLLQMNTWNEQNLKGDEWYEQTLLFVTS